MKNKLNALLGLSLLGLAATAYATTCYLNAVVLCYKANDLVHGSYLHAAFSAYPSFYTDVYAEEDAWRYDTYVVTTSWCNGTSNGSPGPGTIQGDTAGFACWYYNPNIGANYTQSWNGPAVGSFAPNLWEVLNFHSVTAKYNSIGTGSTLCD